MPGIKFGDVVKVSLQGQVVNRRFNDLPPNSVHVGRVFYVDSQQRPYVFFPQTLPGIGIAYSSACRVANRPIEPKPYGVLEGNAYSYQHVLRIGEEIGAVLVTSAPPPRIGQAGQDVFDSNGRPMGVLVALVDAERACVRTLGGDYVHQGMCHSDGAMVTMFDLKIGDEVELSVAPTRGQFSNPKFEISTTKWTMGYEHVTGKVIGWDGPKPLIWITDSRPHYNSLGWELRQPHSCNVDPKYQYLHSERVAARVTLLNDPSAFRRVFHKEAPSQASIAISGTVTSADLIDALKSSIQAAATKSAVPSIAIPRMTPDPNLVASKTELLATIPKERVSASNTIKQEGQSMSTEKAKTETEAPSIGDRVKKQLERGARNAPARVARMKALTGGRKALLKVAKSNLNPGTNAVVQTILKSQGGAGAILGLVGIAGTFSAKYRDNPLARSICEEFVDEGIAMGANEVLDFLIALVEPVLESAMSSVPGIAEAAAEKAPRNRKRVAAPTRAAVAEADEDEIEVAEEEEEEAAPSQMMT